MQNNELKVFLTKLQKIVEESTLSQQSSLFLIIIDNLPMLNLGFGHLKTNDIILGLQAELAQKFGKGISLFRIESDQIAIIYNEATPPRLIEAEVNIKNTIRSFGNNAGLKLHVAATIGYTILDDAAKTAEEYLSELYHNTFLATADGTFLDSLPNNNANENSLQEMIMANEITLAIASEKLKLAYQPIIHAQTGKVAHYEGLLRLENDKGELESAGIFIPIAERMGFIDIIDLKTLQMTIAKLREFPEISLAVNISHLTIGNREWLRTFFAEVTSDIASRLIVEITETAANHSLRDTAYFIATLQEAGCHVALDDFGSGHTSYRQVRSLSIDMIKIDGSLIADIETNTHNQILVEALVKYFKEYGLKIVAEHVDSGACAKLLMDFGIDYMQGHYFGKASAII